MKFKLLTPLILLSVFVSGSSYADYIDISYASFSYTAGGSYGSCVEYVKSGYSSSEFNSCSCAWAANESLYSNLSDLSYNPITKTIKYKSQNDEEYLYTNFANDYTCHIYEEETTLECSSLDYDTCIEESVCGWEPDSNTSSCASFSNSTQCETYSDYGCSWEFAWGGWQNYGSYCAGGSFEIDTGTCSINCASMNEQDCELYDSTCNWESELSYGSCASLSEMNCSLVDDCNWSSYQQACNWGGSQECESYPGCSYSYLTYSCSGTTTITSCNGGTYLIDNGECVPANILGDINGDSVINLLDITLLVNLTLYGEYDPEIDINGDLELSILDIIILVNTVLGN